MSGEANMNQSALTNIEVDTIGEIMNISMGSAATAASSLLDQKVTITTPVVSVESLDGFAIDQLEPAMAVEIKYVEGIYGNNILILRLSDIRAILSQMMKTEISEDYELDDIGESAMCELMNQMMGSSATVLSCFLGRSINISTPIMLRIGEFSEFKREHFPQKESVLSTKFSINIEGVMESEFVSVMDIDLAREIINVSLNFDADSTGDTPVQAAPPPPPPQPEMEVAQPPVEMEEQIPVPPPQAPPPAQQPVAAQQQAPQPQQAPYYAQQPAQAPAPGMQQGYAAPPPYYPPQQPTTMQQGYYPQQQIPENPIMVKEYDFTELSAGGSPHMEAPANIDLVMDVPVVVTVELGRTKRKIKEILEFGQGTIVGLDKQAGSQVDVIVNGQLIARGDVVVVDDNFSIRITEILKNRDSLTML